MLPKEKRLNLKKDFKRVTKGKKINSKFVTIFVRLGDNIFPKIGIALSGKSFKKATERSKVRRIISAAMESLYGRLPENINIVALPKDRVLGVKSKNVLLDLEAQLKNEKIID